MHLFVLEAPITSFLGCKTCMLDCFHSLRETVSTTDQHPVQNHWQLLAYFRCNDNEQ